MGVSLNKIFLKISSEGFNVVRNYSYRSFCRVRNALNECIR